MPTLIARVLIFNFPESVGSYTAELWKEKAMID